MYNDYLKEFYEKDSERFWDPREGMIGRDLSIYPLMNQMSGRVLEYGVGSGSLFLNLALENRFSHLAGVDISQSCLDKIQVFWHEMSAENDVSENKVHLITPEHDKLPKLPDASFDIILALDTIEHVLDPYRVLDELYRVASPEAFFIISVPNYGYIKYIVQLAIGHQPITGGESSVENWRLTGWDGYHLHTFTRQSLNALLRDTGWLPIQWTGYRDKFKRFGMEYLTQKIPSLFSGCLTVVSKKSRN